jgi:hypothetical protein
MAIRTARLAEIFASQGHLDEAAGIFAELLAASPSDPALRERLSWVRAGLVEQTEQLARSNRVDRLRALRSTIRSRRRAL